MDEVKRSKYRVVVGVDFSESSMHAIQEAVQLAKMMPRADLQFVHVLETPPDLHDAYVIDRLSDRMGRTMIKLESYVRDALYVYAGEAQWGCDVAFHVRVGPVTRELHQVAVDVDAELIIVGEDHPRGFRRLLTASITKQLVRDAHVPVVVAHPKDFRGLPRSPEPDPPRPGDDLTRSGISSYTYVDFGEARRSSHISGLV
jgi:nucleotide-binding universal stress UspA family protein